MSEATASGKKRIGLFGGTFDPVHAGHLHLAGLARDAAGLDEVRFMPCPISPHKTGSLPAPPEHRVEMLRLATAALPWATVDTWELDAPQPSYSYLTAEAMARCKPGVEWFWLMGGDQWNDLPRWKHPERLAALVTFLVLPRGDSDPVTRPGYRMQVVTGDHPASSTAVRQNHAAAAFPADFLHPAVAAYLIDRHLYETEPPLASRKTSD